MIGWILDARPEPGGLSLLVSDGRERRRAWVCAPHALYLHLRDRGTVERLLEHPEATGATEEVWHAPPWYKGTIAIDRVSMHSVQGCQEVAQAVRLNAFGEVFNTFPSPVTQALYRLGFPASSKVKVEGRGILPEGIVPTEAGYLQGDDIRVVEDPLATGYEAPHFRTAEIRFFDWFGETTSSPSHHPPVRFSLSWSDGGESVEDEGPLERLEGWARTLSTVDIAMYPRAFGWVLARAGVGLRSIPITLYRHSPGSSSLPEELAKLVEWSRISFLPMGELAGASIGMALTANETRLAFQRRYLIPEKAVQVERRKTLGDLVTHDRGGVTFRPTPGIYWNVAQLDFASMFPALISKWNISPETVYSPYGASVHIPGSRHTVEPVSSRRGIVPEALEWLIARREEIRQRAAGDPMADLRQGAIKWLLVASFGYLGFRNARFGKVEAHECVTALSRHYIRRAIRTAMDQGFHVRHVMVDSLFVQKEGASPNDHARLQETIQEETGLKIKVDAHYDWVILCNNRRDVIGSPARYFGRLRGGELKVKGLDVVRRDTPGVVRKFQVAALKELGDACTPEEFDGRFQTVERLFGDAMSRVRSGQVDPSDWVLTVARGRRVGLHHGGAGGYGEVPFVQIIEGDRPYLAELGYAGVNREHYARLLERAREQVTPLNLTSPRASAPGRLC